MIKVNRNPQPDFYESPVVDEYRHKLRKSYLSLEKNDQRFVLHSISSFEIVRLIKKSLAQNFNGKCAYCESLTEGEVDQFRPKRAARNTNKEVDQIHYWWLSIEWQNQYYCCSICNRNKGNWFPVKSKRIKSGTFYPEVYKEESLIIDPCFDEPNDHLEFTKEGLVIPKSKKGEITIDILKLNRSELVERRKEAYKETLLLIHSFKNNKQAASRELRRNFQIIKNGTSKSSYLAIRRLALLNGRNLKSYESVKPLIQKEKVYARKITSIKNCYVTSVEINNFKSIKKLKFNVCQEAAKNQLAPWTVFLGENGLGKSSILQAISLGLVDPSYFHKFISADKIINNKATKGYININLDDQSNNTVSFTDRKIESTFENIKNYVIGYGSTRLHKQGSLKIDSGTRYFKIKNLFDHTAAIRNAETWLLSINNAEAFASAARVIKLALGLDNSYKLKRNGKKIFFRQRNSNIFLDQMSDGYKSTISLIVDIISVLNKGMRNFEDIEGIVFIDELELHLHPRWKMKFIKSFRTAFPKVQVFATTHEPLCLKGLCKGEVILLKEVGKSTKIFTDLPDVSSLKSEQILTSEFFGLSSTIDPEEEAKFDRYYLLLSKSKLTEQNKLEIKELRDTLPKHIQLGDSLRDDLILNSIDILVAEQYKSANLKTRENLKKSTKEFITNLLK